MIDLRQPYYQGLKLIFDERMEQIDKHERTVEKDVELNTNGELIRAAMYILQMETEWDFGWDEGFKQKIDTYTYEKRLVVAGALIAAEIDRLIYLKNKEDA